MILNQVSNSGEITLLVHVGLPRLDDKEVEEFRILAISAGAKVVGEITTNRPAPDAKYFVGSGKAQEICLAVQVHHAELVLVNQDLSPAQERNLEQLLKCRVLDRTGLILDIFAQRARTFEGKLQVELAQLSHLATRLVRGWTHLERQKGGIGLRGPGETQLETDRRLLRNRIKTIKQRLEKVKKQREQSRRSRQRNEIPTVSLVGYTNAGKSTLFNSITNAEVYVANQLFATLDPTLRRIKLPHLGNIIVADTVGFIRHLPHDLIEAFHATLEETQQANLLLHVIDAGDERRTENIAAVNSVLAQIKACAIPQIEVFNKIDLLQQVPRIDYDEQGLPRRVWLSAVTKQGLDLLVKAIAQHLDKERVLCCIKLLPEEAPVRSQLHHLHAIVSEWFDEVGHCFLEVNLSQFDFITLFASKK